MRGQAFVVFRQREEAELAQRALNGFQVFGKKLVVSFAQKQSYAFIVAQGKFVYKNYKGKYDQRKAQVLNDLVDKRIHAEDAPVELEVEKQGGQKEEQNILLVENVPESITEELFRFLFKQFPGLKYAKLVRDKNIGFAEFLSHAQAAVALKATNGFIIRENVILKVSYATQKSSSN